MALYRKLKIFDSSKKSQLAFDRNAYFQDCVRGKSLLHVGCADFPITEERIKNQNLLHCKLHECAKKAIGIDLSYEGLSILKQHGFDNIILMNAENINLDTKFDLILAGDVLEHMNNPGKFLESVNSLLNPHGELVIGVPSALTINNLKAWFKGVEQVHRDHTFYFSPKTLSTLCERYELLPVKLVFTVQPQGKYESDLFVIFRKMILKNWNSMSPSFIMHFKKKQDVNKSKYFEWR